MPGLIGRSSTLLKAKISALLERAENPAETLDYAYEQQLEDLQNLKQAIADVVTAKKRLQSEEAELTEHAATLDGEAREAMSTGKEDLARAALERKQLITGEIESLDQQVSELESEQQKLTSAEQKLRSKIKAFRSQKDVIKAQYSAAEAQVRISEAATGVGDDLADIGVAMQRALDKTETMKARAVAIEGLQASGKYENLTALGLQGEIDHQLEQLGMRSAVDDELAQLKAELASSDRPTEAATPPRNDKTVPTPRTNDSAAEH